MIRTKEELIRKLAIDGGCIVSSGDCSSLEIADAQATNRMYVDDDGLGFILRPKEWLARVQKRDGLLLAVNKVTAQHRHHNLPTKKALDNLANRQLEYEESL